MESRERGWRVGAEALKGDLLNGVVGNREFSKFRRAICYHTGTHVALYRMYVVTEGMVLVTDIE